MDRRSTSSAARDQKRVPREQFGTGGVAHPTIALLTLAVSQLMIVLDGTIVNVALPSAQRDLGFALGQRSWVVTAYALAFGALLLLGGRLIDVLGRRSAFVVGLCGFAAASVLAGSAGDLSVLIAGRAAQGAFGALLAPSALALLTSTFSAPEARARAFGVFGAVAGGGAAIGLVLGGLLTQTVSWRWTLFVNVLFAAAAVVGALVSIPRQVRASSSRRVDVPGALLVVLGLAGIVDGLTTGGSDGWATPTTIVSLAGGIVLLGVFIIVESRVADPLLPLRVVANRNRGGAYLTTALVSLALFSVFLFLTFFLQNQRGNTPLQAGVAFLPLPFAIAITSIVIAPRTLKRFGPKVLLTIGPIVAAAGLVTLTGISPTSQYWLTIAPALLLLGLGLGHVFAAAPNLATSSLAPADIGVGSAMVNTSQQVGGALGTALLSAVATAVVEASIRANGAGAAAVRDAQITSYHISFLVSAAVLLLLAATTSLLLTSRGGTAPDREQPPTAVPA